MQEKPIILRPAYLRKFGLVTALLIGVVFGMVLPWLRGAGADYPLLPWQIGVGLSLWSLVLPRTLRPIYGVWMKFAEALGWLNSRIILAIMFYVVILPTGILMRLFGKDPMRRRLDEKCLSYRVPRTHRAPDHLEKPY